MEQGSGKTVLVVDDEPDVVLFLQTVLEEAGFGVLSASNGEEALGLLERGAHPDLVTLDLVMPGKSGIRFLYELRKSRVWRGIPVLIVTGHARDDLGKKDFHEIFEGQERSSAATWLEKPVSAAALLDRVGSMLGVAVQDPSGRANQLREEARALVLEADTETVARVIEILRTSKS